MALFVLMPQNSMSFFLHSHFVTEKENRNLAMYWLPLIETMVIVVFGCILALCRSEWPLSYFRSQTAPPLVLINIVLYLQHP